MIAKDLIKGLTIIEKYMPKGESGYHIRAEHDVIYAASLDWPISDKDKKELEELGFYPDEDADGWRAMV